MTIIRKGAEADLHLEHWYGLTIIKKVRKNKRYRIAPMDLKIRRGRTNHEAQIMHDAKRIGVPTPTIYFVDLKNTTIFMEYIEGPRLKEKLNNLHSCERKKKCIALGRLIGRLHQKGIIHGDLTTSNIIINKHGKIFLIDFGLAEYSEDLEKRGVDLLLAKRALYSTHYNYAKKCFNAIIEGYSVEMGIEATQKVIERVKTIEKRGRYAIER